MAGYEEILMKMKEKSVEFANFLTGLNNLNLDIQSRTDKLLKAIDSLKGKNHKLCTVCYTRIPSHAMQPCGHLFCQSCSERGMNRGKCFTCRTQIEGLFRVFL